jgi:hypothetical protein
MDRQLWMRLHTLKAGTLARNGAAAKRLQSPNNDLK